MQTIKPAKTQIFAERLELETKSGFLLTKVSLMPQKATVINVGEEVKQYKSNDIIVYKEFACTDVLVNDKEYILVDEEDVLGQVLEVKE